MWLVDRCNLLDERSADVNNAKDLPKPTEDSGYVDMHRDPIDRRNHCHQFAHRVGLKLALPSALHSLLSAPVYFFDARTILSRVRASRQRCTACQGLLCDLRIFTSASPPVNDSRCRARPVFRQTPCVCEAEEPDTPARVRAASSLLPVCGEGAGEQGSPLRLRSRLSFRPPRCTRASPTCSMWCR